MTQETLPRVGILQRVLPDYRAPFFNALGEVLGGKLSVFAGSPLEVEKIAPVKSLAAVDLTQARNWHFGDPSSRFFLCWQNSLLSWLERWNPHVLIVESNPRYLSTPLGVRWIHKRGGSAIGWGLGAPPIIGTLAWLRSWERRIFLKSFDGWIAYSQRGADEYRQLGLPAEKIFVALNAVTPRPTEPPPVRPPGFVGHPCVLFVGRLQARKRVDLLLRACAAQPEGKQPGLIVVGDGPQRAEWESLARRIYPQAEFPGECRGPALQARFASADLFVLPGTGGLAVQEAMAHALPVIVAEGDGTQNDLVRSENGWLIPSDDLTSLTQALGEALSNPTRLRRMGEASFRIVDEEINLEAMVAAFIKAIVSVQLK